MPWKRREPWHPDQLDLTRRVLVPAAAALLLAGAAALALWWLP